MGIVLLLVVAWAVSSAWKDSGRALRKSKDAYMKRAAAKYPDASPGQRAAQSLRHDAGYWLSQLAQGLPVVRHGLAEGWHKGRTAMDTARGSREEAKTRRLENRADHAENLSGFRQRQQEAVRRWKTAMGADEERVTEGTVTSPGEGREEGREEDREGSGESTPDDGRTYSWGYPGSPAAWPAGGDREKAHRHARHMSGDGTPQVVTEYPAGGGPGTTSATYLNGEEIRATTQQKAEWEAEADETRRRTAPGPRAGTWEDLEQRQRDRGLCPRLVNGSGGGIAYCGETLEPGSPFCTNHGLGDSADDAAPTEDDLSWSRDEAAGDPAAEPGKETGRLPSGGEVLQTGNVEVRDGQVHASGWVFGEQPDLPDGQLGAEFMGTADVAAMHDMAHGPGCGCEVSQHVSRQPVSPASSTEGAQQMASDVNYDGVVAGMGRATADAEQKTAEAKTATAGAEARANETAAASREAAALADQMQGLGVDAATLSAMADHLDARDEATKAEIAVQEAAAAAEKAHAKVLETAGTVDATLKRGHANLNEAHQNAPVEAADKQFYAG